MKFWKGCVISVGIASGLVVVAGYLENYFWNSLSPQEQAKLQAQAQPGITPITAYPLWFLALMFGSACLAILGAMIYLWRVKK